ncbi:MAG: heme A synthase [Alphaproteobacteria bacterium]|nr:heme A synthase [Alphaproteobacteria bacterium]
MAAAVLLPKHRRRWIGVWLWASLALIFAMVAIGGITRLTESGLSITEWRPLIGAFPPLSDADWQRLFELYRQSPEFQQKNFTMDLTRFKTIFWWEYAHRLWGRVIGIVYFVPFVGFWWRGWFGPALARRLLVVFCLGGLQGAVGWWMVASGLVDRPEVSAYRLALHLALAFLIAALILWTLLDLAEAPRNSLSPTGERVGVRGISNHAETAPGRRLAWLTLALVSATVVAGALVAGNDAGLVYNSFPLMDGYLLPPDYLRPDIEPAWRNLFESHAAVQLHHRVLALASLAVILWFWWAHRRHPGMALPAALLATMALAQVALGIATLLAAVPIALGVLHQAGAFGLFLAVVWTAHATQWE